MEREVLEVRWPIADDTRTMPDLVGEASRELRPFAARVGMVVVGDPEWSVAGDEDLVLVARVEVWPKRSRRDAIRAADAAAAARVPLVAAPTCELCWRVAGPRSGLCTMHRKAAAERARGCRGEG